MRRIRQLANGGSRRWRAWQNRHVAAIPWLLLCDGGVVAALGAPARARDVRIALRIDGGPERRLPVTRMDLVDGVPLALADLAPGALAAASRCTLTVSTKGGSRREDFAIGPGRYVGRIDGVRDYGIDGWVSPLFPTTAPRVQLLVDGVAGEPVPLDRHRRELVSASSQGGWNGFRLPIPETAFDGRPHHLAVRAGDTVLEVGAWSAEPHYNIDSTDRECFIGWYFDASADDAAVTIRIVKGGRTYAHVRTHFRSDIKAIHARDHAGFDFRGWGLEPDSDVVAGGEGAGILIGRLGDGLVGRVGACRARARAALLGPDGPEATIALRRSIRDGIVEIERKAAETYLSFTPAGAPPTVAVPEHPPGPLPPVCAIVPVYKGLSDLKACLGSLIPQLGDGRARAIVIDDGSPEAGIGQYLADLGAKGHPGLTILSNPVNLGFIATVNRGFSLLEPGEDAILVNADTILPSSALEKLARHCHARPGIASVTPMSNNATILSFPSTTVRNAPALGLDVGALDQAFAREAEAPVVIPTGNGFCLYLNRLALDEVGLLSPDWGRGYCEEVDWCLTARDLGWVHLAATDTFVVHEGSVSFGASERLAILKTNHARLEDLYPEFIREVDAFLAADPLGELRIAVLLRLCAGRFRHLTLHLMHGLGGGTKRYVDDLRVLPRSPDQEVAVLSPDQDDGTERRLSLAFDGMGMDLTLDPGRLEGVLAGLERAGVRIRIHVNSRLTYGSAFLTSLLSGTRPYVVMLHDFQWYCPRVHLTDERAFYCGEPPPAVCQLCVAGGIEHSFGDQGGLIESDLESWLGFNAGLLRGAERLLAPSKDTADRYGRRLGLDVAVVPHPEPEGVLPSRMAARRPSPSGELRLAAVGSIGPAKGYHLLRRMTERAARDRMPYFLTVIGRTADDAPLVRHGNAMVTGSYRPPELKGLLDRAEPDFVFLASVWPETYSYVLSEIWQAGYPVVAFDLGAQADRIRAVGGGVLIPPTRDTRAVLDSLLEAKGRLAAIGLPRFSPVRVASLDAYDRQGRGETGPQDRIGQEAGGSTADPEHRP